MSRIMNSVLHRLLGKRDGEQRDSSITGQNGIEICLSKVSKEAKDHFE